MRSHLLDMLRRFWKRPKKLTPRQLQAQLALQEAPLVLDVRTQEEFSLGHIAGATLLPVDTLESQLDRLAPHRGQVIVTV